MNFRKKMSEIILLTLAVLVGGGYVYYSLLTNTVDSFNKNKSIVFNNTPVVTSNTRPGSISAKKQHKVAPRQQISNTSGVSGGPQFSSAGGFPAMDSRAALTQSGSTGYSYSYSIKSRDNKNSSQGGYDVGGMLAYSSRDGSTSDNGLAGHTTGGVMLSETGAITPLAVPFTPATTPPTNGNGMILVDPGTYTTPGTEVGEPIPIGEGWWVLILLALGYVVWKKTGPLTASRSLGKGEIQSVR